MVEPPEVRADSACDQRLRSGSGCGIALRCLNPEPGVALYAQLFVVRTDAGEMATDIAVHYVTETAGIPKAGKIVIQAH